MSTQWTFVFVGSALIIFGVGCIESVKVNNGKSVLNSIIQANILCVGIESVHRSHARGRFNTKIVCVVHSIREMEIIVLLTYTRLWLRVTRTAQRM